MSFVKDMEESFENGFQDCSPAVKLTYQCMQAMLVNKAIKRAWKAYGPKDYFLQVVFRDMLEALKTKNVDHVVSRIELSIRYNCIPIDKVWNKQVQSFTIMYGLTAYYSALDAVKEIKAAEKRAKS